MSHDAPDIEGHGTHLRVLFLCAGNSARRCPKGYYGYLARPASMSSVRAVIPRI
jgi:hypothetical protein